MVNLSGFQLRAHWRALPIGAGKVLPVTFDCWRVQILAARGANTNLKIEGVQFLGVAVGSWPGVLVLGGVMVNGHPVPFKQTINFSTIAAITAGDWMVVEEYLEPVQR